MERNKNAVLRFSNGHERRTEFIGQKYTYSVQRTDGGYVRFKFEFDHREGDSLIFKECESIDYNKEMVKASEDLDAMRRAMFKKLLALW